MTHVTRITKIKHKREVKIETAPRCQKPGGGEGHVELVVIISADFIILNQYD